jgi:hypothetical protein
VFESLKKRRTGVFRAVPVPPELLDMLDLVHGIRVAQRRGAASALLWPWSRVTAWRRVQEVIAAAGIPDGPHACPAAFGWSFGAHGSPEALSAWSGPDVLIRWRSSGPRSIRVTVSTSPVGAGRRRNNRIRRPGIGVACRRSIAAPPSWHGCRHRSRCRGHPRSL